MAEPKKVTRMVITVDLATSKIVKVVGMDDADIDKAIAERSVEANELRDYQEAYQILWSKEPLKFVGSIFWTHHSPGCGWVLQDGWYKWICSRP